MAEENFYKAALARGVRSDKLKADPLTWANIAAQVGALKSSEEDSNAELEYFERVCQLTGNEFLMDARVSEGITVLGLLGYPVISEEERRYAEKYLVNEDYDTTCEFGSLLDVAGGID